MRKRVQKKEGQLDQETDARNNREVVLAKPLETQGDLSALETSPEHWERNTVQQRAQVSPKKFSCDS